MQVKILIRIFNSGKVSFTYIGTEPGKKDLVLDTNHIAAKNEIKLHGLERKTFACNGEYIEIGFC